ncbi:hypothetical protein CMUS01_03454 [Colletotrichum musicola]|uniref:Uncharacterized protein n=1 Tax=Colletotrichum musicola TaxID=2175873 RepID=A0A8H6U6E2_9PEZI|nr:hypothetical protein CMUS01_03454 [Colletotrichum musicola]
MVSDQRATQRHEQMGWHSWSTKTESKRDRAAAFFFGDSRNSSEESQRLCIQEDAVADVSSPRSPEMS